MALFVRVARCFQAVPRLQVAAVGPALFIRLAPPALMAALLAVPPVPLAAQEDTVPAAVDPPAVVVGRVTGAAFDEPLVRALIYVKGQPFTAVTDSAGLYALPLPEGAWMLSVYHPRAAELDLPRPPASFVTVTAGTRLRVDFSMDPEMVGSQASPYVLEALEVMVEGFRSQPQREIGAHMELLDREVLEARRPAARHVGDLIQGQFTGIRVRNYNNNEVCIEAPRAAMARSAGGTDLASCAGRVAVVLDDVILTDPGPVLAGMSPDAVTRIEYLPAFWATTRWGRRAGNGVLFIWTR